MLTPTEQPKEGRNGICDDCGGFYLPPINDTRTYAGRFCVCQPPKRHEETHPSCRSELERVVGELRRAIAEEPCSDTHILAAFDRRCGELGVTVKV